MARHVTARSIAFGVVVLVGALLITGCPQPIDFSIAARLSDTQQPSIVIVSPTSGTTYSQTVDLDLLVTDRSDDDEDGGIQSIEIIVSTGLSILLTETISPSAVGTDGHLLTSIELSTQSFSGPIVIRVIVTDWNDNASSTEITLEDPGNDIPSFTVVEGNQQVEISWEQVSGAESYTLYYTTNGTLPSQTYGQRIDDIAQVYTEASPYVISDLANGSRHVFQLAANTPGGSTWYSDYVEVIPLSSLTLVPILEPGYEEITVQWPSIPGADSFEVYRATSFAGPYINLTGTVTGTSFIDTDVVTGQEYFYKVRPAGGTAISSGAAGTVSSRFVRAEDRLMRFVDTPGYSWAVDVEGDYAFVAAFHNNLQVIDISDPEQAHLVAASDDPNVSDYTQELLVQDGYAYMARGGYGLQIIDVSDPTNPVEVAAFDYTDGGETGGSYVLEDIAVDSKYGYAYLSYANFGIVVVDVSDPANPTALSQSRWRTDSDGFGDIAISGQYIYVNERGTNGSFQVLDVLDRADPDLTLVRLEPLFYGAAYVENFFVDGNRLYVSRGGGSNSGVEIFSIASPSNPVRLGYADSPNNDRVRDLHAADDVLYAAAGSELYAYDITSPSTPRLLYTVDAPGLFRGVRAVGTIAVVADYYFGVQIVKTTVPPAPELQNSDNTNTAVSDIEIRGSYGYAANRSGASPMVQVFDLSNPTAPSIVGSSVDSGTARGIAIRGDYAFVSGLVEDGQYGLVTYDISDPTAPTRVAGHITSGSALDVDVYGEFAIVADGANGMQIVNIADPTQPGFVRLVSVGTVKDVVVSHGYAFLGTDYGVKIVDLHEPAAASVIATLGGFYPDEIAVNGGVLAVSTWLEGGSVPGLALAELTFPPSSDSFAPGDPNAATMTFYPAGIDGGGVYSTPGGVGFAGNIVFWSDWPEEILQASGEGLHIFVADDPSNAVEYGLVEGFGYVERFRTYGSMLYVIDGVRGLLLFEM